MSRIEVMREGADSYLSVESALKDMDDLGDILCGLGYKLRVVDCETGEVVEEW